jgi:hypothetical protein
VCNEATTRGGRHSCRYKSVHRLKAIGAYMFGKACLQRAMRTKGGSAVARRGETTATPWYIEGARVLRTRQENAVWIVDADVGVEARDKDDQWAT